MKARDAKEMRKKIKEKEKKKMWTAFIAYEDKRIERAKMNP